MLSIKNLTNAVELVERLAEAAARCLRAFA